MTFRLPALSDSQTRGIDIDRPEIIGLRRRILRENTFLRRIYEEWYAALLAAVPPGAGAVVEIGSGAGFFREFLPGLVATDLHPVAGIDLAADATRFPFRDGALRAIVMTNVFHHIAAPRLFLGEAARCLRVGGTVAMIEPWVTPWSRLVYRLHHEPFDAAAAEWEFRSTGPLSGANSALPWLVFERDRAHFEQEFPSLRIRSIRPTLPFRYLLSGGLSHRPFVPVRTFEFWSGIERRLSRWFATWAMFAEIVLDRTAGPGDDPAAGRGGF